MRISLLFLVPVMAGLIAGCDTLPKKKEEASGKLYQGATFELQHPPSVTPAVQQGDGYAVHYFRVGDAKNMMGIYEGQYPRLFSKLEKDLTVMRRGTTVRENILRGDDAWGIDSNGRIWRESVWSCERLVPSENGKTLRFPTMIHIWYFGATEVQQAVFDGIANTIEMKR